MTIWYLKIRLLLLQSGAFALFGLGFLKISRGATWVAEICFDATKKANGRARDLLAEENRT